MHNPEVNIIKIYQLFQKKWIADAISSPYDIVQQHLVRPGMAMILAYVNNF